MSMSTLAAAALFGLASGLLFLLVGQRVAARKVHGEAALASRAFVTWWWALAASTLVGAAEALLAIFDLAGLAFVVAATYVSLFFICLALWGLLYYLLYLFTGRMGLVYPLTCAYVGYYFALVYYVSASQPIGVTTTGWSVQLEYAQPIEGPIVGVLLGLLVLPQILAALAYLFTAARVSERSQRIRVVVTAAAIIVWFSTGLLGAGLDLGDQLWWQVSSRTIGVLAAGAILAVLHPPRWLSERVGLEPYAAGSPASAR